MIRVILSFACLFNLAVSSAKDTVVEPPIEEYEREHWAFQPIDPPDVPSVRGREWATNEIDVFVLWRMHENGISPSPRADRVTLVRRVFFDLHGLPPTSRDVEEFVGDARPNAYERLVDRLLASPQYGQRWAQYWLDLARFAETDGYEHDKERPAAWKYRDWVVRALSSDLPYDQFVQMQIAGDILAPKDSNAELATAFCLSGPDMPDINSQVERKHVLLNELTSTVGSVFLSLQVGCAQCHDHKYDPISQADFYRLRAYFDSSIKLERNRSVTTLVNGIDPDAKPMLYARGDWTRPTVGVSPAAPRIVANGDRASGSRVALAKWLTSRSNPLVARSIVNRIWQFHFGKGFVSTPSDFGLIGDTPSHPQLLDYLALKLIENNWSLKFLHREILLSSTYKLTSIPPHDRTLRAAWDRSKQRDPENLWLSRFARRRLDAEAIRDALYASSDSLNHAMGGPGARPPLPAELVKTLRKGQWTVTPKVEDHYRRSLYLFARRNLRYPMFATFDRPAANCSCAVRHNSTTAIQSLSLLNSRITRDASVRLAKMAMKASSLSLRAKCELVYRRILSRKPSSDELSECLHFVHGQADLVRSEGSDGQPEVHALTELCRALFNSNAFLYVD